MPTARHRNVRLVEDLRLAIDCLPVRTRRAMLEGVLASRRVIVGAYVDGDGGVCPMLAAHRRGGRTDFLSFARSWDRFTRAGARSRQATERELSVLVRQLEASLAGDAGLDLARAISEHRELLGRSERTGAADRGGVEEADPVGEIVARRLRRATHWLSGRREPVGVSRGPAGGLREPVGARGETAGARREPVGAR